MNASSIKSALVVGLGSIGLRHLNNLHQLGVKRLGVFRQRQGQPPGKVLSQDVRFYDDYDVALQDGYDAVIIANPTALHLDFAAKALRAEAHVYLEKPVSDHLEGAQVLLRIAQDSGRVVQVGCQLRFHPCLEQTKAWLEEGRLGRVFTVQGDMGEYLPDWHPWEDYRQSYAARKDLGGGVILTQIHDLDYFYWLFGPMKSVHAIGGRRTPLEINVEDTALLALESESGVLIQLRMDYWRKPTRRAFSIVGENGEIRVDVIAGQADLIQRDGKIAASLLVPATWERNAMFLAAMQDFLTAVERGSAPRIPLCDGVEVLSIAAEAKRQCAIS